MLLTTPRIARPIAHCAAVMLALITQPGFAGEPHRVLSPSTGGPHPVVLLVPGCSGFVAHNGFNSYQARADQLQAAGYVVVFVDYLAPRKLTDCAGGRDVSHAEIAKDILEAALWAKTQPSVAPGKIYAIGWSYGAGGVLSGLSSRPPGPPALTKAVLYYPDCRRAAAWTSPGISVLLLMGSVDRVALPALCDEVIKNAPHDSVRAISYPNARHAFDMQGLPERTDYGGTGYNAEAAQASWAVALEFLR